MNLLVVGAGEMGRWFAGTVGVSTAFADRDPDAADAAVREFDGDARRVPLDTAERFDVVCVAVPIPAAADAVTEHAPKADRAVVDVAGVMEAPLDAMRAAAPERERLSLHPLFAAANAPGNVAVAVDRPGPATDRLVDALERAGNALVEVGADDHDRAMRTVQGQVHAAVLAFGLAADDVPEGLETPIYESLADLVDQVTGNSARVYADIQDAFGGADDVAAAARRLADADRETFEDLYEDAGR